jgi:hypothetical protein
MGELVYIPS